MYGCQDFHGKEALPFSKINHGISFKIKHDIINENVILTNFHLRNYIMQIDQQTWKTRKPGIVIEIFLKKQYFFLSMLKKVTITLLQKSGIYR